MQKLVKFHDLYLQTDVLLLCDVFENVRATCIQHYKLDPSHYFSATGLAWGPEEASVASTQSLRGQTTNISKTTMQASRQAT